MGNHHRCGRRNGNRNNAVAKAGYRIIMACYNPKKAEIVRERLSKEIGNPDLEVIAIDLSSMQSVVAFCQPDFGKKPLHCFADE